MSRSPGTTGQAQPTGAIGVAWLAYVLDMINAGREEFPSSRNREDDLRTLLYFWRFPSGRRYRPPPQLVAVAEGWRLFQARQYQRYAIESLWVAYLQIIAKQGIVPFRADSVVDGLTARIEQAGIFAGATPAGDDAKSLRVIDLAEHCLQDGQRRGRMRDPNRFQGLWDTLGPKQFCAESTWKARIDDALDSDPALILGNAVGLLVTLWARWRVADDPSANKYLGLGGRGRVSLRSMFMELDRRRSTTIPAVLTWHWKSMQLGSTCAWPHTSSELKVWTHSGSTPARAAIGSIRSVRLGA